MQPRDGARKPSKGPANGQLTERKMGILDMWRESRGGVMRKELDDAMARVRQATPEEGRAFLSSIVNMARSIQGAYDAGSTKQRKLLLKYYKNAAHQMWDRGDWAGALGVAVVCLNAESRYTPGSDATLVKVETDNVIRHARELASKGEHDGNVKASSAPSNEGLKKAAIRSALSTVGARVEVQDDVAFVSAASHELVVALVRSADLSLADDDTVFVAGIFCVTAADHFSSSVGVQFEMSSSMALIRLAGDPEEAGRLHGPVIAAFNDMATNSPKQIQAIGNTLAQWVQSPTPDRWKRLVELFLLFRSNLAPA